MSKKNFKTPFDSLLGEDDFQTQQNKIIKEVEVRATFIIKEKYHTKLKFIAYNDRKKIKDVLDEAISNYCEEYEKNHGTIDAAKK